MLAVMTKHWTQYLQQAGAQFEAHTVLHFGEPLQEQQQALHGDIITDLSFLGMIEVTGVDTEKFLQGQFINDIRLVNNQRSQLSAWCSPKGRVLMNFRLFKREESYYLLLPRSSVNAMLQNLRKYVLRADVKMADISSTIPRFGIAGAHSTKIIADCLGRLPPVEVDVCITSDEITVLSIRGSQPRYIVLDKESTTLKDWWQCAATRARPVGTAAWQLLDILAGVPQISPTTADKFVPQMLNLVALGSVNFKKGCYVGQEVVARTQYLGTLKRRMYLIKIEMATIPQPGDVLYSGIDDQQVGEIINAQIHPEGGIIALAVIQISYAQKSDVYWHDSQGESVQILDLPYLVETMTN